ncbi:MAG: N-acyl homoserine lactonase family protein, partial [Candidatus Rokubacteria bacterium]|nr:N-acyl homoserine lactonase family protein [Candidatus Rokubacteria bacterium]
MIKVFALCSGFIELDRASMISDMTPGQPWTVPVLSFVVDHPRGRLLFDTGIHCQARLDPLDHLGPERMKRLVVKSKAGEDVVAALTTLGLAPADVRYVANSHLHFDHCGGNEFFPRATFLVQRPELEAARRPGGTPSYSPSPRHFEHPLDYQMLDGEHDVFGDGAVVLFPTYGHTPGHQSLRVRAGKAQLVAASDACYTRENMDRDVLPNVLWNAGVMRESLATLRALRDRAGATMVYGHDPAQWGTMPPAP